jgi:hypothetical protein
LPNGLTSAGWMFWFCNTRWVFGFLIFQNQRTSGLFGGGFFFNQKSESKEPRALVIWKASKNLQLSWKN